MMLHEILLKALVTGALIGMGLAELVTANATEAPNFHLILGAALVTCGLYFYRSGYVRMMRLKNKWKSKKSSEHK